MADETSRLGIDGAAARRKKGGKNWVADTMTNTGSFAGKHDLLGERMERDKKRWKKRIGETGTTKEWRD